VKKAGVEADRRPEAAAIAFLPGLLTLFLAFSSGGYFPGATALVVLALTVALLLRIVVAEDPLEGVSPPLAVAAGALLLYGLWAVASTSWSGAPARALLEADRVLLYLLTLLFFGSFARRLRSVQHTIWGLAVAMTALSAIALITRTMPDVWPLPPAIQAERLSYPIGYWNALGLLAALALLFSFHLTSDAREPRLVRVLAAGALPIVATTLLFTFSRGPIAVAVVGLLGYTLLGRPRLVASALLASAGPTAMAVAFAYRADLLASGGRAPSGPDPVDPASPMAIAQGHEVAAVVAACALAAGGLRAVALALDSLLERVRLAPAPRRLLVGSAGVLVLAFAAVLFVRFDVPGRLEAVYDRAGEGVLQTGDRRDRLLNPGLERQDLWGVAVQGFQGAPLTGEGAGTFELQWAKRRPTDSDSYEAHSLYLETLSELGVVGLVPLGIAVATILGAIAFRTRKSERASRVVLLAGGLMWAVNAGIDWFWELPAVTLWVFAAAGLVLARTGKQGGDGRRWSPLARGLAGLGCVALAATPASIAVSQARLAESVRAYEAADCGEAIDSALASISALSVRPEPYEILAFCDVRQGLGPLGVQMMHRSVDRDPENWRLHYGMTLVRAAAGFDPRASVRRAQRLNPRDPQIQEAVDRLRGDDPRRWRAQARALAPPGLLTDRRNSRGAPLR